MKIVVNIESLAKEIKISNTKDINKVSVEINIQKIFEKVDIGSDLSSQNNVVTELDEFALPYLQSLMIKYISLAGEIFEKSFEKHLLRLNLMNQNKEHHQS